MCQIFHDFYTVANIAENGCTRKKMIYGIKTPTIKIQCHTFSLTKDSMNIHVYFHKDIR